MSYGARDGGSLRVAIVASDDDRIDRIENLRRQRGVESRVHRSADELLAETVAHDSVADVILCESIVSTERALALVERLDVLEKEVPVVAFGGRISAEEVVTALRGGVFEVVNEALEFSEGVFDAIVRANLSLDGREEPGPLESTTTRSALIGESPAIRAVREAVTRVAKAKSTVLITGETGTGKELVARSLHSESERHAARFVPVNCGGLAPSVLESELFGHAKGAFTGAIATRPGLFVVADRGTLFLDEIGEMDPLMQGRLLRILQDQRVRAVGSDRERSVDIRLVAATNKDLAVAVEAGEFREDLYYRLNVFRIDVPPLRERVTDIPELTRHILAKQAARIGRAPPAIAPEALSRLVAYEWPGNVRQLENVLERAIVLADRTVGSECIYLGDAPSSSRIRAAKATQVELRPLREAKAEFEQSYLESLLKASNGNRADAARLAQLDPSNLRRLLKRYGLA